MIDGDANRDGLSDVDVYVAWRIGIAAFRKARDLGAKFPADPSEVDTSPSLLRSAKNVVEIVRHAPGGNAYQLECLEEAICEEERKAKR